MAAFADRQAGLDQIRQGWTPRRVGRQIIWLDETASTNSLALDMASGRSEADGLVVLADYQTAGRGRQGRQWLSPRGASVLCSVVVVGADDLGGAEAPEPHPASHAIAGRLTVVAAVAACEAMAEATDVRAGIKWPNDLRISGRKVGGILIESRALSGGGPASDIQGLVRTGQGDRAVSANLQRAWVIGFGINCLQHAGHFPSELGTSATSLDLEASHAVDRVAMIRALLMRLDHWLGATNWVGDPRLHAAWEQMCEPIGQHIQVRYRGHLYSGRTMQVDPVGGLTIQLDNGRQMWFDPMLTSVVP